MSKDKPVHEVRVGVVKAAIWANETKHGIRDSVAPQWLYKDGDDWKTTESFGRDELPLVSKVADVVHTRIYREGGNGNGNGDQHV